MRRSVFAMVVICIVAVGFCIAADAARQPAQIRVLLITGDDVSAHPWREISETTRQALVDSGKFDVRVCEDPLILESETALKAYDVIVFTIYSQRRPTIPGQAQENLLNFVKGGKGFFVQHLASASFAKWEEFGKLCGRKWVMGRSGHGPRNVFEAKVVDKQHPVTAGMDIRQAGGHRRYPRAGRGRLRLEQEDRAVGLHLELRQGPHGPQRLWSRRQGADEPECAEDNRPRRGVGGHRKG